MKRKRPYFRISIKGYYPEDSKDKLKVTLYTKNQSFIGTLIQFIGRVCRDITY